MNKNKEIYCHIFYLKFIRLRNEQSMKVFWYVDLVCSNFGMFLFLQISIVWLSLWMMVNFSLLQVLIVLKFILVLITHLIIISFFEHIYTYLFYFFGRKFNLMWYGILWFLRWDWDKFYEIYLFGMLWLNLSLSSIKWVWQFKTELLIWQKKRFHQFGR